MVLVLAQCSSSLSFNSHNYFQRNTSDKLINANFGKGNNSVITCDRATILAFTQSLISFYQCIKFHLIPSILQEILEKDLGFARVGTKSCKPFCRDVLHCKIILSL